MKKNLLFLALLLPIVGLAQTRSTSVRNAKTNKTTTKVAVQTKKINLDYQAIKLTFDDKNKSLRLKGDSTNCGYVVFTTPGYSQKDIYQKFILGLNNIYTDIDQTVTKIEYDAITINAVSMPQNALFKARYWDLPQHLEKFKYRIAIKIKDGKVRIDTPVVSSVWTSSYLSNNNANITDFKEVEGYTYSLSIINDMENILERILRETFFESKNNDW